MEVILREPEVLRWFRCAIGSMLRQLLKRLGEFFLMKDSEQRARWIPLERRRALRAAVERATGVMSAADRMEDRELRDRLAREALRRLVAARVFARGAQFGAGHEPAADVSDETLEALEGELESPSAREVVTRLRNAGVPPSAGDWEYEEFALLFAMLESPIDVRGTRAIAFTRAVRLTAAVVAFSSVLWLVLGPRNLAVGKTVTTSSVCPYATPAAFGRTPISRVVDGVRIEGAFAACTNLDVHPWLTVDLGDQHQLSEVVVYNRSDCCWGLDDLPLSVQVSHDNRDFVTVGTTTHPFTQDFPWRVHVSRQAGRYVRLINLSNRPSNIIVNEFEVYGR